MHCASASSFNMQQPDDLDINSACVCVCVCVCVHWVSLHSVDNSVVPDDTIIMTL